MDTREASERQAAWPRERGAVAHRDRSSLGRLGGGVRCVVLATLAVTAAGCGGGGNSTGPSRAPVISTLAGQFFGPCTREGGGGGTFQVLTLSYVDGDGNLIGGSVQIVAFLGAVETAPPVQTLSLAIPSALVSITGTTSGTIRVILCATFGPSTSLTEMVTIVDAANNQSNALSITTPRPAGVPELPRGGTASGYGS